MSKTAKRFALSTLIAAAAGYLTGVLTAPKSGQETRQELKDAATSNYNEAERRLKKLQTELSQLLDDVKAHSSDASGKARAELDQLTDTAAAARQKAREILSAVHEGEAGDKDLQRAVTDAGKAIKHLRAYLGK